LSIHVVMRNKRPVSEDEYRVCVNKSENNTIKKMQENTLLMHIMISIVLPAQQGQLICHQYCRLQRHELSGKDNPSPRVLILTLELIVERQSNRQDTCIIRYIDASVKF